MDSEQFTVDSKNPSIIENPMLRDKTRKINFPCLSYSAIEKNQMKISPDKKLFWFLKENITLDLSNPSDIDMYIQQVLTRGRTEDIKNIFKNLDFSEFKKSFVRLKRFLPRKVRKF